MFGWHLVSRTYTSLRVSKETEEMQMRNHHGWWTIPLILQIYTLQVAHMALAHSGCQRFPKLTISCGCFSSRPGEQTTRVLLTFVVIHISPAIVAFVSLSYSPSSSTSSSPSSSPSSSQSSTCFVSIPPTLCLPMSLKTNSPSPYYAQMCVILIGFANFWQYCCLVDLTFLWSVS